MDDWRLFDVRAETRRLEDALATRMRSEERSIFAKEMLRIHLNDARPWRVAVAEDLLSPEDAAQVVAEWAGLRYVDLSHRELTPDLISMDRLSHYVRWGYAPLFKARGRITYVATDPGRLPPALRALPREQLWVASEHALSAALEQALRPELTDQAAAVGPFSARCGWSWGQRAALVTVAMGVAYGLWRWSDGGGAALFVTMWLISMLGAGLRILVTFPRRRPGPALTAEPHGFEPLPPQPTVSILIPLYKEADGVPDLMRSLASLDYPKARIDARILIESDDVDTLNAVRACAPPHVTAMVIPDGRPRTKPRAMNYALPFVRGAVLTVFDAEDRPESDQLLKAVKTLKDAPPHVVCAQARLRIYNRKDSWISRLFAIEYWTWFRYVLPGLARMGALVPLGGTSFYIYTKTLREVGGWDAWNVTEDAELGLRLYRRGLRATVVDSDTWEEATTKPDAWIGQRSRWIKGFLQTIVAHSRAPVDLIQKAGPLGALTAAALFLTPAITFLLLPLFWILWLGAAAIDDPLAQAPGAVKVLLYGMWFAAGAYLYGLNARAAMEIEGKWGWRTPILFIGYWPMATVATARAALELATAPFYWNKTRHVVSPKAKELQRAALDKFAQEAAGASGETAEAGGAAGQGQAQPQSKPRRARLDELTDPLEIIDLAGFGAYRFAMSDASDPPRSPAKPAPQKSAKSASGADDRAERLAAALRANLRRRKSQARSRKDEESSPTEPSDPQAG